MGGQMGTLNPKPKRNADLNEMQTFLDKFREGLSGLDF